MPEQKERRHMVDLLFVLTLFCVFAISALTLVTLGADIYQVTVDHMNENFTSRTPYSYLTQKIRQSDEINAVALASLEDVPAIVMKQTINHREYTTYLYQYNGYLCELLSRSDQALSPSAGNKIIAVSDMEFEQINEKLFAVNITTSDGETLALKIGVRCGNEETS